MGKLDAPNLATFLHSVSVALTQKDAEEVTEEQLEIHLDFFDQTEDGFVSFDEAWNRLQNVVELKNTVRPGREIFFHINTGEINELIFVPSIASFENWSEFAF